MYQYSNLILVAIKQLSYKSLRVINSVDTKIYFKLKKKDSYMPCRAMAHLEQVVSSIVDYFVLYYKYYIQMMNFCMHIFA